jgi:hypothetical protein
MKTKIHYLYFWAFVSWFACIGTLMGQDIPAMGAFILVSQEGEIKYEEDGQVLDETVAVGDAIPQSFTVITEKDAKLVGLLSNGTLLTLESETRMKVANFEQEAFGETTENLSQLSAEPSTSNVLLDLDYGSLVVKTKKLNKGSQLNINSPVGTAGVRGTEFQMAATPGKGLQLDVTESIVEFTPVGGVPVAVKQGGGLSVSPQGIPTQRPVNPVVAQKITKANESATVAGNDYSLEKISKAIKKRQEVRQRDPDAVKKKINPQEVKKKKKLPEKAPKKLLKKNEDSGQEIPKKPVKQTLQKMQKASSADGNQAPREVSKVVQENDPFILLERKIAKFKLTDEQKARLDKLPYATKLEITDYKIPVVQKITSLDELNQPIARAFLSLSREAKALVMNLENQVLQTLLQQDIDEVLLVESLKKLDSDFPTVGDVPTKKPNALTDNQAQELSLSLMESGNSFIMAELVQLSEGKLTDQWIAVGTTANLLLQDYLLSELTPPFLLSAKQGLENPFYLEVSSLFETLRVEEMASGEGGLLGARNLIITKNAQAMQPYFGDGVEEVILSASEDLSIRSDFEWEAPLETSKARLVLMSGNDLNVAEGVSLRSATSDLVIASRNRLSLTDVELHGAREVSLRGMRDVSLDNVHIEASTLAKIKARRDLDVNGLSFRQDISKIVMEATTLRLKNVNFPGSAQVRLNSSLGGVDGRYPNFGTVSPSQQIGRVNFIENVKSGGNLLNNRAAFDQHGGNIQIGKITNP